MNKPLTIEELFNGAKLTFKNAQCLYDEAVLFKEHGKIERSLFLHQISLEECAKFDLIGYTATTVTTGGECDIRKFSKAIRSHEVKNHTNAYTIPASEEEVKAREDGDWGKSLEIFKQFKKQYHGEKNEKKNNSLYVNFENRSFTSPCEAISESDVETISEQNKSYLEQIPTMLSVIKKMMNAPDTHSRVLIDFMNYMESLRESELEIPKPEQLVNKLQEFYEAYETNEPIG